MPRDNWHNNISAGQYLVSESELAGREKAGLLTTNARGSTTARLPQPAGMPSLLLFLRWWAPTSSKRVA